MKNMTIAGQFRTDDANRQAILESARLCAMLTDPTILPPQDQSQDQPLPESYQSIGARGLSNMVGRMMTALFPPGMPWFQLVLAPEVQNDENIPPEIKQVILQRLFQISQVAQTTLEQVGIENHRHQKESSFYSRKRMVLEQVLGTGDSLEKMNDDFSIRVFRRTNYVTRRSPEGNVIYHITREQIDPLTLSDERLSDAKLKRSDFEDKTYEERLIDLFTHVHWQHDSNNWLIRQEINQQIVVESTEPISPYFSTPYKLTPEEHYGRGFIETQVKGDLRSVNNLRMRTLDFAAIASKVHPVLDYSSLLREKDLTKPSGAPLRGRVSGGLVQDLAFLKTDKLSDFRVVFDTMQAIERELGKSMLIESEVQPTGDRVTAYQVDRIVQELQGNLGGVFSHIADDQQMPVLRRALYQLRRDNTIPDFPDELVHAQLTTGLAELSRQVRGNQVRAFLSEIANLGDAAATRINMGPLLSTLARMRGINEPGLIKTDEQLAREQQAAMQQDAARAAMNKTIETAGNVVEANAQTQETQ